jgi:hypothetical protein
MATDNQKSRSNIYTRDFTDVYTREVRYLTKRRETCQLPPRPEYSDTEGYTQPNLPDAEQLIPPDVQHGTVGLALSGGGIRSATFNLGVLQGLCKHSLLRFIDYLSTVSGGGYIGSCLSSLLDNPNASVEKEKFPFRFERGRKDPGSGQWADERKEVKHLRQYGNYLAPDRSLFSPQVWRLVGSFISGLVLTNLIPFGLLILIMKIIQIIGRHSAVLNPLPTWIFIVAFGVLVVMVLVRWGAAFGNLHYSGRLRLGNILGWFMFVASILLVVGLLLMLTLKGPAPLEKLIALVKGWLTSGKVLGGGLASAALGLLMGVVRTESSLLRLIRTIVFRIAWLAVLPILYLFFVKFALRYELIQHPYWPFVISGAALIVGAFINSNRVSIHHIYRDRLSEAYIIKRQPLAGGNETGDISLSGVPLEGDEDMIVSNESLCLHQLHRHATGPYHLINATLNVPDSRNRYLRGRGAELFLFSKEYVGAMSTGYRDTSTYENGATRLATAMAVSGAAASPQLGSSTSRILTLMLTLLNVRLNRWMPNPNPEYGSERRYPHGFWFWYFMKELLGRGRETDALLNISDGGHHENLGVYPLLQRRCRFIIASDAGADPSFRMSDLANLMRKARIDLGVTLKFDLKALRPDPGKGSHTVAKNVVCGTILYPEGKTGVLVYIKSSLTGREPEDILTYDRENPDFPDESTGDQFFDEGQFESYRELGYQIASTCFKDAGDWFEGMYRSVLKNGQWPSGAES